MLEEFDRVRLQQIGPNDISDALEAGNIVSFPDCPIQIPDDDVLATLRDELPGHLKRKNISYHPEADQVRGLAAESGLSDLVYEVLTTHSARVTEFLDNAMPNLFPGSTVGTCSFRPVQEQGRNLKAHASNELIHIDAGAYGATNGDRILRFFVNLNPVENRVWATRGRFPELYRQYGKQAGLNPEAGNPLDKNATDKLKTTVLKGLDRAGLPFSRVLDSSPYDRAMRQFHNFMKDTPEFQNAPEGRVEISFKPFSAWMVFTDMVSHACLSGQHAFIYTALVPLRNCQHQELAPYNILSSAA